MNDMVVVADSHITRRDEEMARLVACFASLEGKTSILVLLGDVFNIWLGKRRFEMPHMGPLLEALRRLAATGTRIHLIEGNRDFHIADGYLGDPFEAVVPDGEEIRFAGRRFWLTHGDRVNEADWRYGLWRAVSKSAIVWRAFSLLPRRAGVALGDALEARLRGTNVRNKSYFPEEACEAYGRKMIGAGFDRVLIGHIHIEKILGIEEAGRSGRLIVVPDWRSSRRYLRYTPEGGEEFVDFDG